MKLTLALLLAPVAAFTAPQQGSARSVALEATNKQVGFFR